MSHIELKRQSLPGIENILKTFPSSKFPCRNEKLEFPGFLKTRLSVCWNTIIQSPSIVLGIKPRFISLWTPCAVSQILVSRRCVTTSEGSVLPPHLTLCSLPAPLLRGCLPSTTPPTTETPLSPGLCITTTGNNTHTTFFMLGWACRWAPVKDFIRPSCGPSSWMWEESQFSSGKKTMIMFFKLHSRYTFLTAKIFSFRNTQTS